MSKNKPTTEEVAQEAARLRAIKPKVRQFSMFGDDNHAAIEAQLDVLESRLKDEHAIFKRYLANEGEDEHNRTAALSAWDWMQGVERDITPSSEWESLFE